jgi:hypothetical protein
MRRQYRIRKIPNVQAWMIEDRTEQWKCWSYWKRAYEGDFSSRQAAKDYLAELTEIHPGELISQ